MTKNAIILSVCKSVKGNPACFFCQCLFEKNINLRNTLA